MPGNVKLGSGNEPDPDPTPYMYVSAETKTTDMRKPYDPKKSVWVPDDEGGFLEAMLQSDDGKKALVLIGKLYENFVRKRLFVKYQSQSSVIKVML